MITPTQNEQFGERLANAITGELLQWEDIVKLIINPHIASGADESAGHNALWYYKINSTNKDRHSAAWPINQPS